MPKNIIVLSDGTGQFGGLHPDQTLSNVYKLYRAVRAGPESPINPADQIAFYDPGLGSAEIGGPFWEQPLDIIRKFLSSATGTGFSRNVVDCYEAILKYYSPGDRVFLFGFSRGAYTVRSVAGVMNLCGVPSQDRDGNPIPRHGSKLREIAEEAVRSVYEHGAGHLRTKYFEEREEKARRFRETYSTQDDSGENLRGNVVPYFIGVFDTVAALGTSGVKRFGMIAVATIAGMMITAAISYLLRYLFGFEVWITTAVVVFIIVLWAMYLYFRSHHRDIRDWPTEGARKWHFARWKFKHYDKYLDPRVRYGRHAQAIDETRKDFDRVGWGSSADVKKNPPDWLVQRWFAGNHSDIGGSYPENESRLSDIALKWMLEEVMKIPNPLIVDESKLHLYPDPSGIQHCEVTSFLEAYPSWFPSCWRVSWTESVRDSVSLEGCHPSVLDRVRLRAIQKLGLTQPYRPDSLKKDPKFLEFLDGLAD